MAESREPRGNVLATVVLGPWNTSQDSSGLELYLLSCLHALLRRGLLELNNCRNDSWKRAPLAKWRSWLRKTETRGQPIRYQVLNLDTRNAHYDAIPTLSLEGYRVVHCTLCISSCTSTLTKRDQGGYRLYARPAALCLAPQELAHGFVVDHPTRLEGSSQSTPPTCTSTEDMETRLHSLLTDMQPSATGSAQVNEVELPRPGWIEAGRDQRVPSTLADSFITGQSANDCNDACIASSSGTSSAVETEQYAGQHHHSHCLADTCRSALDNLSPWDVLALSPFPDLLRDEFE